MQSPTQDLDRLSDDRLTRRIDRLVSEERTRRIELLCALATVEERRLHHLLGYSSMFDYLRRALGYRESAAVRRVKAARALRENPELLAMLESGEVCLSTIALFAPLLEDPDLDRETILDEVRGKSQAQVREILATYHPQPVTPDRITPVGVRPHESGGEEMTYRFEFEAGEGLTFLVCQALEILSTKHPKGLSLERLFEIVTGEYVERHEPTNHPADPTVGNPRSRHVPKAMRSAIYQRDGGGCTYVGPGGVECRSRWNLEIHHDETPYAAGGKTDFANMTLHCSPHNLLRAIQDFGPRHMALFGIRVSGRGGNEVTAAGEVAPQPLDPEPVS